MSLSFFKRGFAIIAMAASAACGGGSSNTVASGAMNAVPAVTGSSATSATATARSRVTTPASSTSAVTLGLSAASFQSIVNGQEWPASFRPYAANPWNAPLPAAPTVDSTNTANVRTYMKDAVDHITGDAHNDYSHPVYAASANDPQITIDCSRAQYGCFTDQSAMMSSLPKINVPALARPSAGTDAHFAVVQPDGTEYDFWHVSQPAGDWSNGATLSASIAVQTSITGSGIPAFVSATSGAALAGGLIRFDELQAGTIPHAIFLDFSCTQGRVYPGTSNGVACGGSGVPMGALVHLNMSDAQIDALPPTTIAPFLLPILHALHQYGGYVLDTYGGSSSDAPFWEYESFTQFSAFGQPYPGTTFATAHGYSGYHNPTYLQYAGGPIRWSQLAPYIEVLAPCYAHGSC
jgi:hypothetical protein